MKEYKLETVNDLFKAVTCENIERLMLMLYKSFDIYAQAKENLSEDAIESVRSITFTWTDDGKNDICFDFVPTENDEE